MSNRKIYKYRLRKTEITLENIVDNYNVTLQDLSRTNFFFWYKMSLPIVIVLNILNLSGLLNFPFLNILTGISGATGSFFILYSIFKSNISKNDLTGKLIIPSFVILFLSLSITGELLEDIVFLLSPFFLIIFITYYIHKNKTDKTIEMKSLGFYMSNVFKVFHIVIIFFVICIIFLFISILPSLFFGEKQTDDFLRFFVVISNFFNIMYFFNLNFLNEFKKSISHISQENLFRLEKEAESRQKKRYFLGMEFNKLYFSAFGFFIIPIIKNLLEYIKRKNNLTLENSIANFFKEYNKIFSLSIVLFTTIVFFVLIFDNMSYLSRNTVFKNITKSFGNTY